MMRLLRRLLLVFAVSLGAVWPASADIKAFNEAVQRGDYKTAAVAAKSAWASFDKTSAATATVAREFGFASYMAGDYAAAREYGEFLQEQGKRLPTPDDEPEASAVLLHAAEYRLNPKGASREDLLAALKARVAASGVDNISVMAGQLFYRTEWARGAWSRAESGADLTAELLGRAGETWRLRTFEPRIIDAAAGFLQSRTQQTYEQMLQVQDDIVDMIDTASDERTRELAAELMYQTRAWLMAMEAATPRKVPTGSLMQQGIKSREYKQPSTLKLSSDPAANECAGRFDTEAIRYPPSALFVGTVGAVLVKVDVDASGAVVAHKILAAVPANHFADGVAKAAPSIRLQRTEDDPPDCRLEMKGRVLHVAFLIK